MSQGFTGKNFTFQRWDGLYHPIKNLSLNMSTFTTTYTWATGTSTNNLITLTTDASADGTGALLFVGTGNSSTVTPLLVKSGATTALTVNASAQVLIGTLTNGRVTYAGASGLLQDSANMTFDGNKLSLATTGSSGGLLIGADANLYRSAADTLKTDDSLIVGTNLSVLNAGTFSLYESGSVNFSSFAAGTQAADLRYTLPTSQPSTNHVLTATAISGSGPYDITLGWAAPSATISIGSSITSGTAGSVLFVGAGAVLAQDNNNFFWDDTNNYLGLGTAATPAARLHVTGNQTAAAWTTNGVLLRVGAATLTDSSSTGTVAASVANAIQTPTFAASSSTTYTDAATLYISANPTAGTNVTITNGYALWVDSGATRLDGNLIVGSLTSTRIPYASTGGLLVDSANMTFNGTRLALATTGNTGGLLIGGDTNLYRSAADTITTDDAFIAQSLLAYAYVQAEGYLSAGLGGGGTTGQVKLLGDTTGTVTIQPQSNAGTYNFNLPITAGSSGEVLTSAGGGGTAMTWTAPGALAVRWSSLANPTGNLSLTMSTNTATFNWATGTSTNNLLSLTTDASANGTGALLNIATGTSATVIPLLVKAGATTGLTVNASAQVLVGTLTSTRVTYAGTNGLLQDSANMTFDGNRLALATTGNTGGLLIGGDANLYRSAADTLKTDDAFVTASTLTGASSLTLGAASGTTGSILIKGTTSGTVTVTTAAAAGTWTLTLPTSGGTSGNVLRTDGSGTTSWVAPGIPWTEVTGTSQSASANNGYVTNNAALVTVTLPTPAVGSVVEIVGIGAGGWKAQCASSHTIRLGTIVSAATGYAASTNQYDSIRIVGISTTAWSIVSVVGTIDVV